MFSAFISLLIYTVQICIAVIIASVIPIFAFKKWKRKKVFVFLLFLCLSIELLGVAHLMNNPFLICQEEYCEFVSEEDKQDIIAFNSGIYSKQIPVIPVCIVVKHADDISIVVETYYLMFGHTEMLIGDDGPTYLRTLFYSKQYYQYKSSSWCANHNLQMQQCRQAKYLSVLLHLSWFISANTSTLHRNSSLMIVTHPLPGSLNWQKIWRYFLTSATLRRAAARFDGYEKPTNSPRRFKVNPLCCLKNLIFLPLVSIRFLHT